MMPGRILFAFSALLLLSWASSAAAETASGKPGSIGVKPPVMVLADPKGASHDITRPDGKNGPVCIYFWSVFCSNCKEAMPILLELDRKWKDHGLTIWAVNVDGDRFSNAVEAFLKDSELPLNVVYDRLKGEELIAADPLSVTKTPTLILLDVDGVITIRQEVAIDPAPIEKFLAQAH